MGSRTTAAGKEEIFIPAKLITENISKDAWQKGREVPLNSPLSCSRLMKILPPRSPVGTVLFFCFGMETCRPPFLSSQSLLYGVPQRQHKGHYSHLTSIFILSPVENAPSQVLSYRTFAVRVSLAPQKNHGRCGRIVDSLVAALSASG